MSFQSMSLKPNDTAYAAEQNPRQQTGAKQSYVEKSFILAAASTIYTIITQG